MRLSRQARIHRAEIEEAFLCSQDDKGIARHFRVPLYEIMALRMVHEESLAEQRENRSGEEAGSASLKEAIHALFRNWEAKNGFREGAAELLLPAGYVA